MSIRLEAVIERWPDRYLLAVPALPGFSVSGADAAELQRAVSDALKVHLAWLVRHELIDEPAGEIDLSVVEQARAQSAAVGPLFQIDLPLPSEQETETALAIGRAAISEFIDAYDLPDTGVDAALLNHVAERDGWYAARLATADPVRSLADPIDRLIDAAGAFEEAVDAFIASDRPDLWETEGEQWTLAKVLRRRTAHLREHAPALPTPLRDETLDLADDLDDEPS